MYFFNRAYSYRKSHFTLDHVFLWACTSVKHHQIIRYCLLTVFTDVITLCVKVFIVYYQCHIKFLHRVKDTQSDSLHIVDILCMKRIQCIAEVNLLHMFAWTIMLFHYQISVDETQSLALSDVVCFMRITLRTTPNLELKTCDVECVPTTCGL